MKQLSEKVAIITGCGQGIGKGVALCMAKRGVRVTCIGRRLGPVGANMPRRLRSWAVRQLRFPAIPRTVMGLWQR